MPPCNVRRIFRIVACEDFCPPLSLHRQDHRASLGIIGLSIMFHSPDRNGGFSSCGFRATTAVESRRRYTEAKSAKFSF